MGGWKRSYHFHSNKTARLVNLPRSSFDKNSWSIIPGYIQYSQEFIKETSKKTGFLPLDWKYLGKSNHILQKNRGKFCAQLGRKKKLRPAAPRLDRVSMVHLDNSRSGFTCSMRNFLEVSPNDWETKRTICEMDLNRWFPREKDPMIFIVAKSLHIWIIYLYMFCCIKKIYYLFTTRVTTTNLYCGFFPKLIGGKCSTPPLWNHCSCPHSLLSRFLFLRIIPTTSNNR